MHHLGMTVRVRARGIEPRALIEVSSTAFVRANLTSGSWDTEDDDGVTDADVTDADLTGAWWPTERAVPDGWTADLGRLSRAVDNAQDAK